MAHKYKYRTSFTFEGRRYEVRADTKEQLYTKKALKLRDLKDGKNVINKDMTVSKWAFICVNTYKTNQAEITRVKFVSRMRHCILEYIGDMKISKVKPVDCQNVMNLQVGNSPAQINNVYSTLKFIFSHAVENNLIINDPTKLLTKPKAHPPKKRRALTPEERTLIERIGETDRRYYIFLLMLYCGCRPSEAAECMGKDIVNINGINMLHIRGTKTKKSDRHVPIPDKLYNIIKGTPPGEYVSPSIRGLKQSENSRRISWLAFKRDLNIALGCEVYNNQVIPPYLLADDLVPYCLRHEFCTELARNNVDIRQAQKLMGHASINMTANIYTNLTNHDLISVAAVLGATQVTTSK